MVWKKKNIRVCSHMFFITQLCQTNPLPCLLCQTNHHSSVPAQWMCLNMVPQNSLPNLWVSTPRVTGKHFKSSLFTSSWLMWVIREAAVWSMCVLTKSTLCTPLWCCVCWALTHGLKGKLESLKPSNPKILNLRAPYKPISLKVLRNKLEKPI